MYDYFQEIFMKCEKNFSLHPYGMNDAINYYNFIKA